MQPSVVAYLVVMSAVTLGTRILPLTLIRKPITNRFFRRFSTMCPYVTLAVMTFPAILTATDSPVAGAVALFVGHRDRVAWGRASRRWLLDAAAWCSCWSCCWRRPARLGSRCETACGVAASGRELATGQLLALTRLRG